MTSLSVNKWYLILYGRIIHVPEKSNNALNLRYLVVLSLRLADVYCPILILHDKNDEIISFELGKKVIRGNV